MEKLTCLASVFTYSIGIVIVVGIGSLILWVWQSDRADKNRSE